MSLDLKVFEKIIFSLLPEIDLEKGDRYKSRRLLIGCCNNPDEMMAAWTSGVAVKVMKWSDSEFTDMKPAVPVGLDLNMTEEGEARMTPNFDRAGGKMGLSSE